MATQTVEFLAVYGQTLTAKLYAVGSDTLVQTASAVTEQTNRVGVYRATFTDVPAGEYELHVATSGGIPVARWYVTLTLTTATFASYDTTVRSVTAAVTVGTNNDKTGYTLTVTPPTAAANAAAVWDEILTGNTHNIQNSAGKRLRTIASQVVHTGTAQGPGTGSNQIQLDTGASATDGVYDPAMVFIESGTGAGQTRLITQYVGSTRTATVDRDWRVAPAADSVFVIQATIGFNSTNEGLAQGGTATTIVLNSSANSVDDCYNGQLVFLKSGTGQDQVAIVEDYTGSTRTALIRTRRTNGQWATIPDSTTGYMMVPNLTWTIDEIQSGLATAAALATLTTYVDTEVASIKVVTDRLGTGLVADGAVWQFTANMLELAPAGGGGAGDASQTTLLQVQSTVNGIASSLSGVPITATGRIADGGTISLYCGDDLRVRSGTQLTLTVTDVGGSIYSRLNTIGTGNLAFGASRRGLPVSAISGSIASLTSVGSGASQTVRLVVEIDNAGGSLQPAEDYEWQIESEQAQGAEIDQLVEMAGILILRRRAV